MVALHLSETTLRDENAEEVAAMLNEAYEELRCLPRLDIYSPTTPPVMTADGLLKALEIGDLDAEASCVVWRDTRPVAAIGISLEDNAVAKILWLAVIPDCRRQGIGKRLVSHAIAAARSAACSSVVMERVDSRWCGAVRFLESQGFTWVDPDHCNMTMQMDIS
ncbi:MAG: GNAT family N-acetyltransferase, partial [Armatimonadetes bacterium]|nr:GNAT family N-acetyltransferase [Armatimonadota bacterium]